jgi:hypothetical protein
MSISNAKSRAKEAVELLEGLEQTPAPVPFSGERRDALNKARLLLEAAAAEIAASLDI